MFFGLNHNHDARHLTQAVWKGILRFADCQQVLVEAGAEIGEVSLIGGGAQPGLGANFGDNATTSTHSTQWR